ncbi:MAG: site-specific DNA-methyltransferase [Armatimonadetes bacterium]|nr:site-specific DNA-methyltransferase [Akkermansiaceae bacterium]
MPSLEFKGKQFVHSHHLSVPFRELLVDAKKSLPATGEKASLADNLIIQGDNLEALKALLPTHAGKIDCIFIDPPYNTGGDWSYNDNVRSPLMKEWLKKSANPVDKEDLERHDKWLSMMWPRLLLLRELLSENGFLAIAIDDNEQFRLGCLLDEIFGEEKKVAVAPWRSDPSGGKQKSGLRIGHEYILIYHNRDKTQIAKEDADIDEHQHEDSKGSYFKGRELLKWGAGSLREDRTTMWFPLTAPDQSKIWPYRNDGREGRWRLGNQNRYMRLVMNDPSEAHWEVRPFDSGVLTSGKAQRWVPYEKIRTTSKAAVLGSWLDCHGTNADGTEELKQIFGVKAFDTPKPVALYEWLLGLCPNDDAIVLDSFAGSATTAHAVLRANANDGGQRRFILVQLEEYLKPDSEAAKLGLETIADIAAERVRRVISGYKYTGTQRTELFSAKLTWTAFKKAPEILEKVESIELLEGAAYDSVKKEIKGGMLTVVGERKIEEITPGLGGSFTYCELGDPIEIEALLTGKGLPAYESLARYVFYTATGKSLEKVAKPRTDGFIGETELFRLHLIYQPEKEWLRSNEAALDATRVEAIAKGQGGKRAIVFAVAKFMSQKDLSAQRIEFCQLPYAVHRILGD